MSDYRHSLLRRQLRKYLPEIPPGLEPLLTAIDQAYAEADSDRLMLERSLELTSQELLQRNSELRTLMEANPDFCLRLDRQGRLLDWYGQGGSEVFWTALALQQPFCADLPPEAAERLSAALERCLTKQRPERVELSLSLAGKLCVLELGFVPIFGGSQGLVMLHDATERYRFEEQQAQRNRELLSFHMMAEVSMTSASLGEVYSRIAKELQVLTGFEGISIETYDPSRGLMVIQASSQALGPLPLEIPLDQTLSGLVAQTGQPLIESNALARPEYSHPGLRALGVQSFVCIPLRDEQAETKVMGTLSLASQRVIEVSSDFVRWMTSLAQYLVLLIHRKQNELALRQSKQAAEEANLAKTRFLATMSHELRTPLNSVLGFASVLSKSSALSGCREQSYLQRIHNNGLHLLHLINEVLDISRIEAGQHQLELCDFSLPELLVRTLLELEPALARKSLHWCLDCPAQLAPLRSDPAKLNQILTNLLANAVKFTPEGGSIRVRVLAEHGQVSLIEVADSGIGIPAELQAKIFEPFFQVDSSYARVYEGSGLGLAICKSLARMLDYELGVFSKPGHGATFRLQVLTRPAPRQP